MTGNDVSLYKVQKQANPFAGSCTLVDLEKAFDKSLGTRNMHARGFRLSQEIAAL